MKKLILIFLLSSNLFALAPTTYFYAKEMHRSGSVGDDLMGHVPRYFNDEERLESLVFIENNIFYDYLGRRLDTFKNIECDSGIDIGRNCSKFVMDNYGNIYINNYYEQVKHSYFLGILPVASAGWMKIRGGKLIEIIHDSGHYRPNFIMRMQLALELNKRGLKQFKIKSFFNDFLGKKDTIINSVDLKSIKYIYSAALSLTSKIRYITKEMTNTGSFTPDSENGEWEYYFTQDEKLRAKINFKDGLMYDFNWNLIDTCKYPGISIFYKMVMDTFGNFYINNHQRFIKHSFFLSGYPVSDAGSFKVYEGKLVGFVHDSGHYKPNFVMLMQSMIQLFNNGIKEIRIHDPFNGFLGFKNIIVRDVIRKSRFKIAENIFSINKVQSIYFAA